MESGKDRRPRQRGDAGAPISADWAGLNGSAKSGKSLKKWSDDLELTQGLRTSLPEADQVRKGEDRLMC